MLCLYTYHWRLLVEESQDPRPRRLDIWKFGWDYGPETLGETWDPKHCCWVRPSTIDPRFSKLGFTARPKTVTDTCEQRFKAFKI